MDKLSELKKLEEELEQNPDLPLRESNLVFGEGYIDAQVVFIGEAPGFYENEQRRPFVGRAGKLLDQLIQKVGWQRKDVYITNIVKRRPPENRDPLPEEIEAYKPYLARHIQILNPKIVVALGRFSMNYFLPAAKISRDHGKLFRISGGRFLVPFYHPAAALRSTSVLDELEADFKKLPAIIAKSEELAVQGVSVKRSDIDQKDVQNILF